MKRIAIILLLVCSCSLQAQTGSNKLTVETKSISSADSLNLEALFALAWEEYLYNMKYDSCLIIADSLLKTSIEMGDFKYQGGALLVKGVCFHDLGENQKAIEYFELSRERLIKSGYLQGQAAIETNLSNVYSDFGDDEKAIKHLLRSIEIRSDAGDSVGMRAAFANLGGIYADQGRFEESADLLNKSITFEKKLGDTIGAVESQSMLASVFIDKGDLKEARELCLEILAVQQNLEDFGGLVYTYNYLARIAFLNGHNQKALEYANRSHNLSVQGGRPADIEVTSSFLTEIYKSQGKMDLALNFYELEVEMRDSINSNKALEYAAQMEAKSNYEKQLLIKQQQEKEAAQLKTEKLDRRNSLQYSGIGLGIFLLFGLVFMIGRIQLPAWAVELSVFLPFLIFFEFLLVVSDSTVEALSGGEPLIKLLINVLMAGAIFPLHSFFEKILKRKLFKVDRKA